MVMIIDAEGLSRIPIHRVAIAVTLFSAFAAATAAFADSLQLTVDCTEQTVTLYREGDLEDEEVDLRVGEIPEPVALRAEGRGAPWIGITDGSAQRAVYHGAAAARSALEQGVAVPISLASGDFDSDGVPDLVAGYGVARSGLIVLAPGRVESLFPPAGSSVGQGERSEAPFRKDATVFELPIPPRWLGVGDFDADGLLDLLAAAPGEERLHWLLGDGHGSFAESRSIDLDGPVTSFTTGQFGRLDGLPEVVVSVEGPAGPEVRIFESPRGLLRGEAEVLTFPKEGSALVIAELTGDHLADLAISAGEELLIVHGRDVRPWVMAGPPPAVGPQRIERRSLSSEIISLVAARFGTGRTGLAALDDQGWLHLLGRETTDKEASWQEKRRVRILPTQSAASSASLVSTRTSSFEGDDLVVVDPVGRHLHVFSSGLPDEVLATLDMDDRPAALLPMRLNQDGQSDLVMLVEGHSAPIVVLTAPRATFTVDSELESHDTVPGDGVCNDGSGTCTLRAAIEEANAHPGADEITFATRSQTIAVTLGQLPLIREPVTILGSGLGFPRMELDGSGTGAPASGLILYIGSSSSVVRSLVINGFSRMGLDIWRSGDNRIEDCYIGTDRNGLGSGAGNGASGVRVGGTEAIGNTVGGMFPQQRNLISNNARHGIEIDASAVGNTVAGNYVGTDPSGSGFAVPNGVSGIRVWGSANNNLVGGPISIPGTSPGNVISGNGGTGVLVEGNGNTVQGNLIGGGPSLANSNSGVSISGSGNLVGGASAALRNVVSGNLHGIWISGAELNLVQGNYVGTDVTGTVSRGNLGIGVFLSATQTSTDNLVGGVTETPGTPPGNVIASNGDDGVRIWGPATSTSIVAGNLIGTDRTGTVALPNGGNGVLVRTSAMNTVGGSAPGARNVISGNGFSEPPNPSDGIEIDQSSETVVAGNFLGVDITGIIGLGNGGDGVRIVDVSSVVGSVRDNRIGGTTVAERNVISANFGNGVQMVGAEVTANTVAGNLIGVDVTGSGSLGNAASGVLVTGDAHGNRIGGSTGTTPGTCAGECNTIAYNGEAGVRIDAVSSVGNAVRANSIFGNAGLGIDLGPLDVTANDALDADGGANDLQNFPEITSASFDGTSTTISGTLHSLPGTAFDVDLFGNLEMDPSGHGEGRTWLASANVVTDSAGDGAFAVVAPGAHGLVSATATGPGQSTSEFGPAHVGPGEAGNLLVSKGPGTALDLVYDPACSATDHVVYTGLGGPGTPSGPLSWTAAFCGLGASGAASFDPGEHAAGLYRYFVIVGQDSEREGSYGRDSASAERPEAVGLGTCDRPREAAAVCP